MKNTLRKFGSAFKAEVALEAIKGIKTIAEIAQQYELHPVQVSQWKNGFLERSAEVFEKENKQREELARLQAERDELFKQIRELRFQNEWVKKTEQMSPSEHLSLIDSSDEQVPVKQQCKWLGISRSSFYYRPSGIPEADYRAMRVLDELYLEDPTRGTRRMCKELRKLGFTIGRSLTRKLMQRMRLRTIYCRPRTTCIDPAAYKFPYLLHILEITRCNQVWVADITYIPMARGYMYLFAIMDGKSRFIVGWSLSNIPRLQTEL